MSLKEAKAVVNRIQQNQSGFKQPAKPIEDNNHPKVVSTMAELFTRLKAITTVGNAFKTQEEEHIVKQEWVLAFAQEGIKSQDIIDRGVEAMRIKARKSRSTTWFPSIGEFIDACLGSDNRQELAERAYKLFITGQKQIDTVGRMVTASSSFELRQLKASECKKQFIELYLQFAENNAVEPLESHLLAEEVQLSHEQQKEAEKRSETARNEFLGKFSGLIADKLDKKPIKQVKTGVQSVKPQRTYKSVAQCDKERERQLKAIKNMER